MGFLDNIKGAVQGRLHGQSSRDDYYDDGYDDGYDDPYYDGDPAVAEARSRAEQSREQAESRPASGLLGNPSRPEADSVSVYTRSGRHLSNEDLSPSAVHGFHGDAPYADDGAYRTADDSWRASADHVVNMDQGAPVEHTNSYVPPMTQPGVFGSTGNTPADVGLTAVPRVASGKLPPYVLKPTSYDDVQMVIRRVKTNQPVVLSFKNLKVETAKRILDFSFGLACGIDGAVEELGDRVFVVLPKGIELSDSDMAKLRKDGVFK